MLKQLSNILGSCCGGPRGPDIRKMHVSQCICCQSLSVPAVHFWRSRPRNGKQLRIPAAVRRKVPRWHPPQSSQCHWSWCHPRNCCTSFLKVTSGHSAVDRQDGVPQVQADAGGAGAMAQRQHGGAPHRSLLCHAHPRAAGQPQAAGGGGPRHGRRPRPRRLPGVFTVQIGPDSKICGISKLQVAGGGGP